jgi:hypothetical protein
VTDQVYSEFTTTFKGENARSYKCHTCGNAIVAGEEVKVQKIQKKRSRASWDFWHIAGTCVSLDDQYNAEIKARAQENTEKLIAECADFLSDEQIANLRKSVA